MNNDMAEELKKKLEKRFSSMTEMSMKACQLPPDDMEGDVLDAFNLVREGIRGCIQANFDAENNYSIVTDNFLQDLRTVLSFRVFFTHEAWHIAEGLSEEQLLAAENAILSGDIAELENLRDQERKLDFCVPISNAYHKYMYILNNLAYLMRVLAHHAKHYHAIEAGKQFVRAQLLINECKKRDVPHFREDEIENLLDFISAGNEELKAEVAYERMEDWDSFRDREYPLFDAEIKKADELERKGTVK